VTPEEKASDPLAGIRCQATSRRAKANEPDRPGGDRCRKRAIPGGTVCVMHGGKAPSVREKARQRVEDMLPLGLKRIKQLAKQNSDLGVALSASKEIIKLNDLEPPAKVDATISYRWQSDEDEAAEADAAAKAVTPVPK